MKKIHELMALEGRVALITGGAGNIGSAMAEGLAELGANIVISDLQLEACLRIGEGIKKNYSVTALAIPADLSIEEEVRSLPEKIIKEFGRLDILVNCAAFVGTSNLEGWVTAFKEQRSDTWRKALEVNLTATFILAQACTPVLKESGHGSIINIASTYGLVGPDMSMYAGTAMGNPAAYSASKGGLLQLTRWL
ncbi:MAG: SDR family NAD(P)-dependent oxidoreductase, partial [bacterium]|nr:SDR family NAD(P)-dependent oxidoreductase [bacterium]